MRYYWPRSLVYALRIADPSFAKSYQIAVLIAVMKDDTDSLDAIGGT